MDARAFLALMTKAKLVFERPDTFLSFPALQTYSYPPDLLNFGAFDAVDNPHRLAYSEFALLVNSLPAGVLFELDPGRSLWELYYDITHTAVLPADRATPDDDRYQAAVALLTSTDPNGVTTDSPTVQTYKQYRDAWLTAVQEYKAQQSTAAASDDPAAQAAWAQTAEPALRAAVAQAADAWETAGFKSAVETAQQVLARGSAQAPATVWRKWKGLFEPAIDLSTDPHQIEFAPTSFSPADVLGQQWPTFTITAGEMARLNAQAPPELSGIFSPDGLAPSTVQSLSFEFRAVSLIRPWFEPAVFAARFWKLPDGAPPVSDGGDPPAGQWPAYVTAVVLARNITVVSRENPTAPPQRGFTPLNVQLLKEQFRKTALPRTLLTAPAAPAVMTAPAPIHLPHATTLPATPAPATLPAFRRAAFLRGALGVRHVATTAPAATHPAPPATTQPLVKAQLLRRFNAATFSSLTSVHPIVTAPPPPPPTTTTTTSNDITIIALICKRLPKSPDPDPTLPW